MKYSSGVKPSLNESFTGSSINSPDGLVKIPLIPIIWSSTDQFPLDLESIIMNAGSLPENCFLTNADNLSSITNKIELRINKIEISGENVDSMNTKLAETNESIKTAKALLKTLPAKKSLIDYTEFKKYATTIIEARNNLEEAKNTLSLIISDLKDLVVDKNDDKN